MTAPPALSEDDIFRRSTQYRLWSYSPESLIALRASTNELAATRVREAYGKTSAITGREGSSEEVECLTPAEELKLVGFYCSNVMKFSDFLEYPTNIKATATQYLKRFYLFNSPMTYHPKNFMPTALFLATKTDNHYTSLSKFASKLHNTTPEAVKAPEFTLVQGLRFSFDVKHPHRGLEGGFMELQAMVTGNYLPGPTSPLSSRQIAEQILTVEGHDAAKWEPTTTAAQKRIHVAHPKVTAMLKTTALLSDAYFLYTPAQIWLSAFLAVDGPLAKFYLRTIVSSNAAAESPDSPFNSILEVLEGCKKLLISKDNEVPDEEELKLLKRIEKKLNRCLNPARADISSLKGPTNPPSKRDSEEGEDGHAAKKRKVEDDDVFGGEI